MGPPWCRLKACRFEQDLWTVPVVLAPVAIHGLLEAACNCLTMTFSKDLLQGLALLNKTCTAENARGVGTRGYLWIFQSTCKQYGPAHWVHRLLPLQQRSILFCSDTFDKNKS